MNTLKERLTPVTTAQQELSELLPIDTAFLSAKALEGLPNSALLIDGAAILDKISSQLQTVAIHMATLLATADTELSALLTRWDERQQAVDATYQSLLRELQKDKVDGKNSSTCDARLRNYVHCAREKTH